MSAVPSIRWPRCPRSSQPCTWRTMAWRGRRAPTCWPIPLRTGVAQCSGVRWKRRRRACMASLQRTEWPDGASVTRSKRYLSHFAPRYSRRSLRLRAASKVAGALGTGGLLRFARLATLPVRRLAQEEFRGEAGSLLLAGCAMHADLSPESAGSSAFGVVAGHARPALRVPSPQRRGGTAHGRAHPPPRDWLSYWPRPHLRTNSTGPSGSLALGPQSMRTPRRTTSRSPSLS